MNNDEYYTNDSYQEEKNQKGSILFLLLFSCIVFVFGISLGVTNTSQIASIFSFFKGQSAVQEQVNETIKFDEFWEVWNLMEEKFAAATSTKPSPEERMQGAIQGMVQSFGDPYSTYLDPERASSFGDDISGNFSGVGMEVGLRNGVITVIAPLPNTPAEQAGIQSGDIIAAIDEKSTSGMTVEDAVRKIRGEKGTEVVLDIAREGEMEILEIAIVRDTITIPTVDTEIIDGVFVISLYSFNAQAEAYMQMALREFVESGSDRLVIDLRGNPGGFLQSAVTISSFFLPTGKIIVTESFGEEERTRHFRSQGRMIREFDKNSLVVLVNRGSASASEIVAGALMAHERATVIGTTTFGKGSVQELVNLSTGASLKVTVARWLTPDGVSISEGGLEPEISVEMSAEDRVEGRDPQMDAAIRFLNTGSAE